MSERAIDVSAYQGRVNWSDVHAAGVHHGFAKASEGTLEVDGEVKRNAPRARDAGVKLGLYHFAHPALGARANAEHFLRVIEPLVHVDDPVPVLDLEVAEGLGWEALWHFQHHFCELVGEAFGCTPMLYSSASWLRSIPFPAHHRPLWGASWGHATNAELAGWHAWQYSAAGRVSGIGGLVDLDSILRPIPTIGRKP